MMTLNKISIHRSISGRLTTHVLLVSALVFLLAFYSFFKMASNDVKRDANHHAHSELNNTIQQIDEVLNSVEIAIENSAWMVPYRLQSPEFMYGITKQILLNNNFISGCAIAFEPNYYASEGHFFSPYSYRDSLGVIQTKQLGNKDYDYHYMDWYQIPKLLKEPYWSEPYYDEGGGEMMMTTYSRPLYDEQGKMYAIMTADISLHWLTELVNNIHAFPNSYNLMVGRNASYIVHPNTELILNETIFSATYGEENDEMKKMRADMVQCRAGDISRNEFFIYYSPVETTCWSVAIVCPHSEVYAGVQELRKTVIIVSIIALLLMLLVCYNSIRIITNPIEKFSSAAVKIAGGDFHVALPHIKSQDEMKHLRDSFEYLQQSLLNYIEELKTTTVNKERIESELRIASAIQMGMLPKIFPGFPERQDLSMYAKIVPAKEVGGDLYDFFIEKDKLYFLVGDVSGKGVPASLVMAVTCRLFRTIALHLDKPERIIESLNNSLSEGNESNMFCTAFLGILDLNSGHLDYCNAGHNAPLLMQADGSIRSIDVKSNLPLGLFEGFAFESQQCEIAASSTLFLYTDGVSEAENKSKEQYTESRLSDYLQQCAHQPAQDIIEAVFNDVNRFADGADQSDDITMLCINYK